MRVNPFLKLWGIDEFILIERVLLRDSHYSAQFVRVWKAENFPDLGILRIMASMLIECTGDTFHLAALFNFLLDDHRVWKVFALTPRIGGI